MYLLIRHNKPNPVHRTARAVEERVEQHPLTWAPYLGQKHGLFDIVEMEFNELQEMRESGTHPQVVKELIDLAAAATLAANRMTCAEDKR